MSTNYDLASIGYALDTSYSYILSGVKITNDNFLTIKQRNDLGIYNNSIIWPLQSNQSLSAFGGLSSLPTLPFSRSTSATYIGSNGLIKYANINVPRFDFNPITLQCKGLLIENTRGNYIVYSNDVTQSPWSYTNVSRTANSSISPDGTNNANLITRTGTANSYIWQGTNAPAANNTYVFSVWLKLGTYTLSGNNNFGAVIKDGNGNVPANGWTNVTVTSAWQRFYTTATFPTTAVGNVVCYVDPNDGPTQGVIGDTWYIWGAQLEQATTPYNDNTYPTSYIPTTSLTATRSYDQVQLTAQTLSSFFNQNNGTWSIKWLVPGVPPSYSRLISWNTQPYTILGYNGTNQIGTYNGVSQSSVITTNNTLISAVNRAAITYTAAGSLSGYNMILNGGPVLSSVYAPFGTVPNQIYIGGTFDSNSGNLNGWVQQVEYYNITIPVYTLQTLTLSSEV